MVPFSSNFHQKCSRRTGKLNTPLTNASLMQKTRYPRKSKFPITRWTLSNSPSHHFFLCGKRTVNPCSVFLQDLIPLPPVFFVLPYYSIHFWTYLVVPKFTFIRWTLPTVLLTTPQCESDISWLRYQLQGHLTQFRLFPPPPPRYFPDNYDTKVRATDLTKWEGKPQ